MDSLRKLKYLKIVTKPTHFSIQHQRLLIKIYVITNTINVHTIWTE